MHIFQMIYTGYTHFIQLLVCLIMAVAFQPIIAICPALMAIQQEDKVIINANCNELSNYFLDN